VRCVPHQWCLTRPLIIVYPDCLASLIRLSPPILLFPSAPLSTFPPSAPAPIRYSDVGTLLDGSPFDSSRDRGAPFVTQIVRLSYPAVERLSPLHKGLTIARVGADLLV
jgi:hypothetical protein